MPTTTKTSESSRIRLAAATMRRISSVASKVGRSIQPRYSAPAPFALQEQLVGGEDLLLQAQQIEEGIIAPDIGNIYVDHAGYLAFCIFLFPVYIITDFPAENNGHFDEFTFYLILTSWLVFCIVIEEIVKPLIATDF